MKHTRREKDREFLSVLASGVVPRLGQLLDDKMMTLVRESTEELMEHYSFFLRLYHRSEQRFERLKEVAVQLTPSEVDEVARRLQALTEITQNLKIGKQK